MSCNIHGKRLTFFFSAHAILYFNFNLFDSPLTTARSHLKIITKREFGNISNLKHYYKCGQKQKHKCNLSARFDSRELCQVVVRKRWHGFPFMYFSEHYYTKENKVLSNKCRSNWWTIVFNIVFFVRFPEWFLVLSVKVFEYLHEFVFN